MPALDLATPKTGIFLKLPSTQVVDLLVLAGYDFVIVDLEHSQLGEPEALGLVRHADVCGLAAIVRIPRLDVGLVNRLLEAGAAGIQLSMVMEAQQVADLQQAMRYAPAGGRSIGNANRPAAYGAIPLKQYIAQQAEHPPLAVIQIETPETRDSLADIVAAGADVLFVGRGDLSVAFEFDQQLVDQRDQEVRDAARAAGIQVGGVGIAPDTGHYNAIGADIALLYHALIGAAPDR
jgi:4-hydroxy-2-oxoheptanedioate aldolase